MDGALNGNRTTEVLGFDFLDLNFGVLVQAFTTGL
jgi:hypothetical protein